MDGGYSLSAFIAVALLHCLFSYSSAGFIETPSMTNMVESDVHERVLLRCRHMRLDADITWLINGTHSRLHSGVRDSSNREGDGTLVDTLTIPATPQYNGTKVVCLARFLDGSPDERSPPVTLIITGEIITVLTSPQPATDPTSHLSTTTSNKLHPTSTAALIITSTAKTTTPLPTTTETAPALPSITKFEITPDPLTVAVEQGSATFYCQHSSSDAVNWRVNGTSLNKLDSPNISTTTTTNVGTKITFPTLLEFHQTTVECVAFFSTSPPQYTSPVTLQIQDTPGPVNSASCKRNHSSNALITFWDPLPSLDINDTDPDIVYGVELYKITCGRDIFVNYEVATTNHTSNTIDPYQIYKAVISPRNNVEGARNGTSVTMKEKFMTVRDTLFRLTRKPHIIIEDENPVPSYYTMTLKSLDGSQQSDLDTTVINATRERDYVTLSMERQIPPQTLWNVSIHAYDCTTDSVEEGIELSTHDIQNVSVNSIHPGQIRVTGQIIDGSTVTGVLVIVYSNSDVHYIASSPADQGQNINVTVTGLTGTNYGVSTFAMENGITFPRVVALPRTVDVDNANEQTAKQASLVEYTLQQNSDGVCINCTFLDNSTTNCVAVVHQRISQLNFGGLMNIKSSHKFNKSGETASGCIEGVNQEEYQVGVIGGRELHPFKDGTKKGVAACSGCIAGAVLGVVCFVASAVTVAVITLVICKRRTKQPPLEHIVSSSESGLFLPAAPTVNAPTVCHQYEECPPNLRNQQREVTDVQGSSDSDRSDLDNSPPLSPRLEEPSTPTEQTSFEQNTMSTSSPTTTETDLSSGSSSPGANNYDPGDSDPGDSTYYDQPVFTKTIKGGEDGDGTPVQSAEGPTYAQPQLTTSSTVTCPPAADNVSYDQVKGFQNSQHQHYAFLRDMPSSIMTPDDHQKTEYATITQQPSKPTSDKGADPDEVVDPNKCSKNKISEAKITEDQAFHTLLCYSSQWQSLGEALSLDEDHLDEIFTNNETNEACLQEMLGLYFKRSDFQHSWEEIDAALKGIGDKSCTTESDMHLQPQPSDGASLEKTEDEPLKQMETSSGGPVLQPLFINKSETSSEPIVDKCSMIQIHGDIETNAASETNSDVKDVSEKERVHEKQEGGSDSSNELCNQEIEDFTSVHDLSFSNQSGDLGNDDHTSRIISNIKSPSDFDSSGTATDERLDRQSLLGDFSPLVFPCVWDPMALDLEPVICQASGEDETDYNTAMKKLLHLTSGSKIKNLLTHHSTKHLHWKKSSTNSSHPGDELALHRSMTTVTSANNLFQPSHFCAEINHGHLCDHCTNKQVIQLGYWHCNQLVDGHSSSLKELVLPLPLQLRCHTKFIEEELRNG